MVDQPWMPLSSNLPLPPYIPIPNPNENMGNDASAGSMDVKMANALPVTKQKTKKGTKMPDNPDPCARMPYVVRYFWIYAIYLCETIRLLFRPKIGNIDWWLGVDIFTYQSSLNKSTAQISVTSGFGPNPTEQFEFRPIRSSKFQINQPVAFKIQIVQLILMY